MYFPQKFPLFGDNIKRNNLTSYVGTKEQIAEEASDKIVRWAFTTHTKVTLIWCMKIEEKTTWFDTLSYLEVRIDIAAGADNKMFSSNDPALHSQGVRG